MYFLLMNQEQILKKFFEIALIEIIFGTSTEIEDNKKLSYIKK